MVGDLWMSDLTSRNGVADPMTRGPTLLLVRKSCAKSDTKFCRAFGGIF